MQLESIADHLDLVDLIARWHFDEWDNLTLSARVKHRMAAGKSAAGKR